MIRTAYIIFCTVAFTLFWGVIAIAVSFFSRRGNICHMAARYWGRSILMAGGIKVTVKGLSNLDPSKTYIYMANHLSNFDIPVLLAYLKVQFRWLAKAELFKVPFFGYVVKRAGYISIDRSNRRSAFQSLQRAAEMIQNGTSVMIFPEGTRSLDGKLGPFKKGGFALAMKSEARIVPIRISGTWQIMSKDGLRIRPGRVTLEIKAPVETKNYDRKEKENLMAHIRREISAAEET